MQELHAGIAACTNDIIYRAPPRCSSGKQPNMYAWRRCKRCPQHWYRWEQMAKEAVAGPSVEQLRQLWNCRKPARTYQRTLSHLPRHFVQILLLLQNRGNTPASSNKRTDSTLEVSLINICTASWTRRRPGTQHTDIAISIWFVSSRFNCQTFAFGTSIIILSPQDMQFKCMMVYKRKIRCYEHHTLESTMILPGSSWLIMTSSCSTPFRRLAISFL